MLNFALLWSCLIQCWQLRAYALTEENLQSYLKEEFVIFHAPTITELQTILLKLLVSLMVFGLKYQNVVYVRYVFLQFCILLVYEYNLKLIFCKLRLLKLFLKVLAMFMSLSFDCILKK